MIDNFASYEDKEKAFATVNSYYLLALNFYSCELNKLHNLEKPYKYWEIIIGRWLREICLIYLDRSQILTSKVDKQKLSQELLRDDYEIAEDYDDFYKNSESEVLELNILHSKLLKVTPENFFLNKEIKIRELKKIPILKKFLLLILKKFFNALSLINKENIFLFSTEQFTKLDKIKIFLKSKARILFYFEPLFSGFSEREINLKFRNIVLKKIIESHHNDSEKELLFFLLKSMPKSYLENFSYLISLQSFNFLNKVPRTIYLDSRFRNDDCFKVQLAEWAILGTKTKVLQHDLNSLVDFDSLFECDEIFDEYLSWDAPKFPPSLRINSFVSKYKKIKSSNSLPEKDLYVCRAIPRKQSFSLAYTMSHTDSIIKGRENFSTLSTNLEIPTYIRLRQGNLINDYNDKLYFKESDKLRFSESNRDILNLISSSRIIVFEGLSTGVCQCLALEKPFLIFLNQDYLDLRSGKLKEFFTELRDMEIICTSATQLVDSLSTKFILKYKTSAYQKRLLMLKQKHTPISKNYVEDWINFTLNTDD